MRASTKESMKVLQGASWDQAILNFCDYDSAEGLKVYGLVSSFWRFRVHHRV